MSVKRRRVGPLVALVGAVVATIAAPTLAAPLAFEDIALEGELRWLAERPDPGAYHYRSDVHITPESLATGVVALETCHFQLDPNGRVVIVFNPEKVQSIELRRAEGVGAAQVTGHRVELRDVSRGATVCIGLRSRLLEPLADRRWRLGIGPLMRRYLDGYLPMEAQVHLHWPEGLLQWVGSQPAAQPGVSIERGTAGAHLRLVFAGRMTASVELQASRGP